MSKFDKLVNKVLHGSNITFDEALNLLKNLGFELNVSGSHHVFSKENYERNVSIKRTKELLPYQIKLLKQVLLDHGYKKT